MFKLSMQTLAWSRALRAALCAPALLLAACGGGGGGGDGGSSASTSGGSSVQAVVITSGNSQAVAAEALAASSNTDAASGASFVTGVQVSAPASGFDAVRLAGAARKLIALAPAGAPLATGVSATQTVACPAGGNITVTSNVSGSGLAAGDSMQISANACTDSLNGVSAVMNGSMTITVVSGNYDAASASYPKSVTLRIVTSNFSVVSGGESDVSNGDVTIALTERSATDISVTITSSSLATTMGTASSPHSVTLVNYSFKADETAAGTVITMSATVETNNSRLGSGTVSYQIATVTPITVNGSGQVTSGSIKVTGSGSALLLTATGTDTFTLQVDNNGDGTWDSTSTVTRTALQALL